MAEKAPVVRGLQRALDHLRTHLSTENEQLRERLRDYNRAGEPRADREVAETARKLLNRADWATTASTAVVEALEAVREAQLEPEPDVPVLLAELLEDVIVPACSCGHAFGFVEAFDVGPQLAITA